MWEFLCRSGAVYQYLSGEVVPRSSANVVNGDGSRTSQHEVLGDLNTKTSHSRHENVALTQFSHRIVT